MKSNGSKLGIVTLCLLVAGVLGGCSYVTPSDQAVLHAGNLNATAMNAKVQADPTWPPAAKVWMAAEAKTWVALDAWAKGAKFPTTAPAGN